MICFCPRHAKKISIGGELLNFESDMQIRAEQSESKTCLQRIDEFDKNLTSPLYAINLRYFEHFVFPFFTFPGLPLCMFMIFPWLIWLTSSTKLWNTLATVLFCILGYTFMI